MNPPLMLTNYVMNPLEIFEIDPGCAPKPQFKIAPTMSSLIISLDLSAKNKSAIKLQITDTVKDMKLTTIIENFDIPTLKDQNEVSQ